MDESAPGSDAPGTATAAVAAVLALGGNLGDVRAALSNTVGQLSAHDGVAQAGVSGLWRTRAVGGPVQPDYLNAAVLIETRLPPPALLGLAQQLEHAAQRRRIERWGPRTLDVDILAYDQLRSDDPLLTLPHPRAHLRAFVLAPWAQIAPDWPLTAEGRTMTVGAWLQTVGDQQVELVDDGAWWQ